MKHTKQNKISSAMLLGMVVILFSKAPAQNVNSPGATTGIIPLWTNGGTFTLGDSQIQDNGTGVGIGTTPLTGAKLTVNGTIKMPATSFLYLGSYPFLAGHLGAVVQIGRRSII